MLDEVVVCGGCWGCFGGGVVWCVVCIVVSIEIVKYIECNILNLDVLNDEVFLIIEVNVEILLEEIGVNFVDNFQVLECWKEVGVDVQGEWVCLFKGLVCELCKIVLLKFIQYVCNLEWFVEIGGDNFVLVLVYGLLFVCDGVSGCCYVMMDDFEKFVKLGYMFKWFYYLGGIVCEFIDILVNKCYFDMLLVYMMFSDKLFMGLVIELSCV